MFPSLTSDGPGLHFSLCENSAGTVEGTGNQRPSNTKKARQSPAGPSVEQGTFALGGLVSA
jgi:hypothetical protein